MARLATILSFGDHAEDADAVPEYRDERERDADDDDDAASDASDDSFEFAFARPLVATPEADALADDLFAHGRIIPAYPVFHRNRSNPHDDASAAASASSATAPPSPNSYCAWTPRSAPGSPAREAALPKSASTGQVPRFRLRDLVGSGAGRRSHSDGKEKFLFLQPTPKPKSKTTTPTATAAPAPAAKKPSQPKPKQSKKKGAAVTEMDMATAHRLFYSKPGAASATGTERPSTTTTSYLPYRPAIVGFFAAAHGLRPKHHPY